MTEPIRQNAPPSVVPSETEDPPHAPRNAEAWAKKVERLTVEPRAGVRGNNVEGRRLTGPVQGFGKMWQKTYSVDIGAAATPQEVIATWKAHFPDFWPKGNRFSGALSGISPGDVALLDLAMGGGVKLSTGVFVLYADDESFTLMTPQGHLFAGWISFSAGRTSTGTQVQAQVLMRANDPFYELGMMFGGHAKEDRFWQATLRSLATHLGCTEVVVESRSVCVDPKRQWGRIGNTWHNSMVRSLVQSATAPFARRRRSS
jgi:hypothetical protein